MQAQKPKGANTRKETHLNIFFSFRQLVIDICSLCFCIWGNYSLHQGDSSANQYGRNHPLVVAMNKTLLPRTALCLLTCTLPSHLKYVYKAKSIDFIGQCFPMTDEMRAKIFSLTPNLMSIAFSV